MEGDSSSSATTSKPKGNPTISALKGYKAEAVKKKEEAATMYTKAAYMNKDEELENTLAEGGLSILQNADDTILFLEHDLAEAVHLKLVLSVFEQLSGLKTNFRKIEVFLLERQNHIRKNMYNHLDNKYWVKIEERFQKKLESWKGKVLSVGGRLVLINSVFSSLPMFMFSFFEAPKGVIKKWTIIDLDSFGKVMSIKRSIVSFEQKALYKLLNEDGAWQELIKKKYLYHKSITQVYKKPRDSQFWFGLKGVRNRIVRKKYVTVASVLDSVALNISFRRTLVGDNLVSWYELVSQVANISLVKGNDKFRWDLNRGSLFGAIFVYCMETIQPRNLNFISYSVLQLFVGLFAYGGLIWFPIEDLLYHLHRATYWICCWSAMCKEEERGKTEVGMPTPGER
ncbi:hypothetical protein U9M48_002747, partial [Paspalum notatum var. saurae]